MGNMYVVSEDGHHVWPLADGQRIDMLLRQVRDLARVTGIEPLVVNFCGVTIRVHSRSNLAQLYAHFLDTDQGGCVPWNPDESMSPADRLHRAASRRLGFVGLDGVLRLLAQLEAKP